MSAHSRVVPVLWSFLALTVSLATPKSMDDSAFVFRLGKFLRFGAVESVMQALPLNLCTRQTSEDESASKGQSPA